MEVLFLGTAAAEGWPAPFCGCHACREARRRRGKDLRTRAGALIDGVIKIDYGPDVVAQMQQSGRDLTRVATLLFTHEHDDHLIPAELNYRKRGFVTQDTILPTLAIYGNEPVRRKLAAEIPDVSEIEATVAPLAPFQTVTTPDGAQVLPLPASHIAEALVLRIRRNGKLLFWGHDSGLFPEETLAALAGTPLDLAVIECTYGPTSLAPTHHMSVAGVLETVRRLRENGAVTDATRVVATHFSHNGGALHDDLVRIFGPHAIEVAFDGMTVEI